MHTNKVYPLDVQKLENELFQKHKEEEEETVEELSFFCNIWNIIFASTIKDSLQEANMKYEDLCEKREMEMESIVMKRKCSVPWYKALWGIVGTVLGMVAVFIGFVLWPTENVFLHPDHWYECMLQCGIVWVGKYLSFVNLMILTYHLLVCSNMCGIFTCKHIGMDES